MRFGDILRELLEEHDLSQREFAQKFNIATSTLGNYINDYREPDYETLKRFADYFDVSIDYLLDHRTAPAQSHREDDLLQIFRTLSPDFQEILLSQSRVLLKHCKKDDLK